MFQGVPEKPLLDRRAALVTAHPSHELRVYRWIEMTKPLAFVIADGSTFARPTGSMDATDAVLRGAGAEPGCIYGAFPEKVAYGAVLRHDHAFFVDLAEELARALVQNNIDYLVGDATEGSILIHDLARLVMDAAVELASERLGRRIDNYDFVLEGAPDTCPEALRSEAVWVQLDAEAFQRKTKAALDFAKNTAIHRELKVFLGEEDADPSVVAPPEVLLRLGDQALSRKIEAAKLYRSFAEEINKAVIGENLDPYRVECLRPATPFSQQLVIDRGDKPLYEEYGEKLVSAGFYREVIRHRQHVLPVMHALQAHVKRETCPEPERRPTMRQAA